MFVCVCVCVCVRVFVTQGHACAGMRANECACVCVCVVFVCGVLRVVRMRFGIFFWLTAAIWNLMLTVTVIIFMWKCFIWLLTVLVWKCNLEVSLLAGTCWLPPVVCALIGVHRKLAHV